MTPFIVGGIVAALLGAAITASAFLPEDSMVAVPLPQGVAKFALVPIGLILILAGVVLPAFGIVTYVPPPTRTPTPTATATTTPTETPFPTMAIVETATPIPPTNTPAPTNTPRPTPLGSPAPQQSL